MNLKKMKDFLIDKPVLGKVLTTMIKAKKVLKRPPKIDFQSLQYAVPIEDLSKRPSTSIESYWSEHTVNSTPFMSKEASLEYLEWRSEQYPFFHELMDMWGDHEGKTIVDYGCGPGNDTVGFLAHSKAKKIIGIDVSPTALHLTSHRLSFHKDSDLSRVRLLRIPERDPAIPLEDNSVDFIYSQGVLHHTTDPLSILKEFYRILKVGGKANIMVYNRNSLWMHLYVAYQKKIVEKKYRSFNAEEAFARTTDGENCPMARCYRSEDFLAMTQYSGFSGSYLGGYYELGELELFKKHFAKALESPFLPLEHKEFLQSLKIDEKGFPLYENQYAGVGGVYCLQK